MLLFNVGSNSLQLYIVLFSICFDGNDIVNSFSNFSRQLKAIRSEYLSSHMTIQMQSTQRTQKMQLFAEYLTYLRDGEHILRICWAVSTKLPLKGLCSTRRTSPLAITVQMIDILQQMLGSIISSLQSIKHFICFTLYYNQKYWVMTMVLIPNNTNNCISKVSQHHTQYRNTTLFLGSLEATKPELLRQYDIKAILTVASELSVICPLGVVHKVINIQDNSFQNIGQYFSECNEWIRKQLERGNVLVHCRAGISRSASIVIAYMMKTKKIKFMMALQKIRQARGVIKPNQGFMLQLKQYERKIKKVLQSKGMHFK